MKKKQEAINSQSVEIIKYYTSCEIIDLVVHNGWLKATLSSGIKFSIKNYE